MENIKFHNYKWNIYIFFPLFENIAAESSAESNIYLKDKYKSDKYAKFQKISTCAIFSQITHPLQMHKFDQKW